MRRLLTAVPAGLALLALAACGSSDEGGKPPPPAAGTATPRKQAPTRTMPGAHRAPTERVPVLMYHVVNTPPPGTAEPELWVSREDLAAQMSWLAAHGYHGVTLQEVWNAWHHGGLLPSRPIVISFDDGYTSDLTNALPVLRSHGWPGVLNLQLNQMRYDLKPDAVRALIRAGWEVDAHTYTHPDLTTVADPQLSHELADARVQLRRTFGVPVNFLCYPAGRYDAHVIEAARAAGYLAATTTTPGLAAPGDPPFELPRIRVNGSDGLEGMVENLAGAGAPT